jgi:hypothetical protein
MTYKFMRNVMTEGVFATHVLSHFPYANRVMFSTVVGIVIACCYDDKVTRLLDKGLNQVPSKGTQPQD